MQSRRSFLKATAAAISTALPVAQTASASAAPRIADEFVDYDALGMAELIRSGEISAKEVVEITIRRIEAIEPIINAMTTRAYDRAFDRSKIISPETTFAGVPVLIKDMVDVGGVRRTDGSRMMLSNIPEQNVMYIDGVEAAGMNIIGMTNVPEFAQLAIVTDNLAFGLSRNPWDLTKSTLGSSGGSGAAVAAGMVPMAHGTDGGGSNRLPSCAQGLFGMKPSRARMLPGEKGGRHGPVKTNQAISRTVRDSAALFHHTEDPNGPFPSSGKIIGPSKRRLRIGYAAGIDGGMAVDPVVTVAQEAAVTLLRELGHEVVEAAFPVRHDEFFTNYNGAFLGQFAFLADRARAISGRDPADSGLLDPFTASLIEYGASTSEETQAAGLRYLSTVPSAYEVLFKDIDVLLSPVMPFLSVDNNAITPLTLVNESVLELLQHGLSYTASANVSGHCAMSVPLFWDSESGLPVGSMFQAAIGDDAMLYELAFELEQARPWSNRWAPYSVKFIPV